MKATRTLLVLLAVAAAAGGCGRTTNPVAPADVTRDLGAIQTSASDSTTTEQRGVHTFGGDG